MVNGSTRVKADFDFSSFFFFFFFPVQLSVLISSSHSFFCKFFSSFSADHRENEMGGYELPATAKRSTAISSDMVAEMGAAS